MESTNMSKHFLTLQAQRAHYLPAIHSLSQEELWRVTREENGPLVNTFITFI